MHGDIAQRVPTIALHDTRNQELAVGRVDYLITFVEGTKMATKMVKLKFGCRTASSANLFLMPVQTRLPFQLSSAGKFALQAT